MKEIQLTQGKVALVDDEDFLRVNGFKWRAHYSKGNWYARAALSRNKHIYMHRLVLPGHSRLDHKDGNGLNNQKINLRPATRAQNQQNGRKHKNCSSRFKGVYWDCQANRWRASIKVEKIKRYLGVFSSEILAAQAYDEAAKIHFKEFARLNFP